MDDLGSAHHGERLRDGWKNPDYYGRMMSIQTFSILPANEMFQNTKKKDIP
jgi:hypothetical protein